MSAPKINIRTHGWQVLAAATALVAPVGAALADVALPPVTIGAGLRTSFTETRVDDGTHRGNSDFEVDRARIHLGSSATENIKFMLNTEYTGTGADKDVNVIDAAAMFSLSDKVNIWAGRFL